MMIRRALPPSVADPRAVLLLGGAALAAATLGVLAAYDAKLAVGALGGLLVLVAVIVRPKLAAVILVMTIYPTTFSVGGVSVQRLGATIAVVAVVAHVLREGVHLRKAWLPLAAVLAYASLAVFSLAWTTSVHGTLTGLASLSISLSYMVAFAVLVRDAQDLRNILWMLAIWSVLLGLWWIVSYLRGISREFNPAGDSNFFSALQAIVLPLVLALAAHARRRGQRIGLYAGVAVIAASVVSTLSRGGIIVLLITILIVVIIPSRFLFPSGAGKLAFFIAGAAGFTVLVAVASTDLGHRIQDTLNDPSLASGRGDLALASIHGFHDHPIAGIGFGAFPDNSYQLLRTTPGVFIDAHQSCLLPGSTIRSSGTYCTGIAAHDAYLESLVELGVPGLVLFLSLLGVTALSLARSLRRALIANDALAVSVATALLIGLLAFALDSLSLSSETNRTLWMTIGLALALPGLIGPAALWRAAR
jgi:O-antigen ligase